MVQQAIERRWPTEPRVKKAIINKVAKVTLETEDDRTLIAGAKVYLTAEGQNQRDDLANTPQQVQHQHIHAEFGEVIELMKAEAKRRGLMKEE
jgi:hypothetical protein